MFAPALVRLVLGISVFGASLFSGSVYADSRPALALPQDSYDFGSVAQGAVVTHEFEVKNVGSADLVIQRIVPSCGCTAATMVSPTVRPGTSEKIRVVFDTSGFMGPKTKTIQILTNDPQNSDKIFTLKGSILSSFKTEPARLVFGELSPASPSVDRQREVAIELVNGDSLEISKATTLSPFLTVTPIESGTRRVRARVEISPEAPRGEFRDRVIFELKGSRSATINVPVTATIAGDVRLSASTVSFGVVDGTGLLEKRIQFENRASFPVSIQSLESSDSAVATYYVEVQAGKQGVLVVKLDPTKMGGDLRGVVTLKTNHPTEGTLSLNVTAVRPPR